MKHRRRYAIAATGLLALGACGGDDGRSDETPMSTTAGQPPASTTAGQPPASTTAGEPPASTRTGGSAEGDDGCTATVAGSELDLALYAPAPSLDPLQIPGSIVGGTELLAIYDALMRWNPETHEWEPNVAESLTSNDDFTEWTLELRPGVTYSNGDPMVAQDLLDNMTRMTGQGRNGSRSLIARVDLARSVATDESTVVFKLTASWSNFGFLLADAPGMVVNPEVGAAVDSAGAAVIGTDPTGAGVGPYTVQRYAPGESPYLVLKARPDYWGGAPCIETINMISIPTDQAKLDSLELGEIDAAFLRAPDVVAATRASGEFADNLALESAGQVILVNQGVGTFDPIGKDLRFRQAVYAALDPAAISQRAFGGELLAQDGFLHPDSYWYTEGAATPQRDGVLARQLVEELKAEGWDGSIRLSCGDAVPDMPVAYEAALEAAGMDVELVVSDPNTAIGRVVATQDFDLACWGLSISDSTLVRSVLQDLDSRNVTSRSGYRNPAVDSAIDHLLGAPDDDARRAAILELSTLYAADVPYAVVGAIEAGLVFADDVRGIRGTQASMYMLQDASIGAG